MLQGRHLGTSPSWALRTIRGNRNRYRYRNLQTSKAPLKSQAQGTSSFTSAEYFAFNASRDWMPMEMFLDVRGDKGITGMFGNKSRGSIYKV